MSFRLISLLYIDDMLKAVTSEQDGLCLGNDTHSVFAYADDVTLFSATITGLQKSINIWYEYSQQWRFRFNSQKSKCVIMGPVLFNTVPTFNLGLEKIEISDCVNILGVQFASGRSCLPHVENRIKQCRQSF